MPLRKRVCHGWECQISENVHKDSCALFDCVRVLSDRQADTKEWNRSMVLRAIPQQEAA